MDLNKLLFLCCFCVLVSPSHTQYFVNGRIVTQEELDGFALNAVMGKFGGWTCIHIHCLVISFIILMRMPTMAKDYLRT
jgi:hypothetical protein